MDSFLEERKPDQKSAETETWVCSRSLVVDAQMCNYEISNHQKAYGTREWEKKLIYLNLLISTRSIICRTDKMICRKMIPYIFNKL